MLLYVNTIKEGRILARNLSAFMVYTESKNAAATHNSFDEVARAANKDIGQASKSVKRGKKLVGSLR